MSKNKKNLSTARAQVKTDNSGFVESLILILYGYITVLTPGFRTFDSNSTKFLAIAILNLLVIGFVFVNKKYHKKSLLFFRNKIGIAYSILIFLSLLSFLKAINIEESILHFSKIFTIFIAVWLVSIIISNNVKVLYPLCIAMTFLLLFDCYSVFKGVSQFISKKILSINAIKSVYSNKNILTSSLFLKIPFSLLLAFFYKGRVRVFGFFVFLLSMLATFFMSSRAFYLATIVILIFLVVYSVIRYNHSKDISFFKQVGVLMGCVLFSFFVFTIIQKNLYPKIHQSTTGIASRLGSVTDTKDQSNNLRLSGWKRSSLLMKRDPLLGVGLGNWKVRVLEYENKVSPNYTYMYKAHNDFIEIATESGIFAGICYLLIFVFIALFFVKGLLDKNKGENFKWRFLLFFCIVAYFFDAFFNFPQDRPEMQALFSLIVGSAIGFMNNNKSQVKA